MNNSSAKLVIKSDLLYALYGATSGEVAISNISGAINQAVLCIKNKENTIFLFQWLKKEKNKITSTYLQGGQGNLSSQIIKNLVINFPGLKEQEKIASLLTYIDEKIEHNNEIIKESSNYKNGLLQQMFV